MSSITEVLVVGVRKEKDSMGEVNVQSDKFWDAQTQRSLEHFSIGQDLMPREMISAFAMFEEGRRKCKSCRRTVWRPIVTR